MSNEIYLLIDNHKHSDTYDTYCLHISELKEDQTYCGAFGVKSFSDYFVIDQKIIYTPNSDAYITDIYNLVKKIMNLINENDIYIDDDGCPLCETDLIPRLAFAIAIDFFENGCEDVEWDISKIKEPIKESYEAPLDNEMLLYYDSMSNRSFFADKNTIDEMETRLKNLENQVFPYDKHSLKDYVEALGDDVKTVKDIIVPKDSQPLMSHLTYLDSCIHACETILDNMDKRLNNLETDQKVLKSAIVSLIK